MARPPKNLIVSNESNEEDKIGIKMDSGGEQFPRHLRHDTANTHYATKTAKAHLPSLKIKIRGLRAGTSRQEDDIEPNTGDTQDEPDNTQEQTWSVHVARSSCSRSAAVTVRCINFLEE